MEKNFLGSKTIWGTVIAVVPTLAPLIGISFSAEDAAMVSNSIDAIITAVGGLLAIYGRIKATTSLTFL